MSWAAIIELILPIIIKCFDGGNSEYVIKLRLRNPKQRHLMLLRRRLNRSLRQDEPDLRRRDRRTKVDTIMDTIVYRSQTAPDVEIDELIKRARAR